MPILKFTKRPKATAFDTIIDGKTIGDVICREGAQKLGFCGPLDTSFSLQIEGKEFPGSSRVNYYGEHFYGKKPILIGDQEIDDTYSESLRQILDFYGITYTFYLKKRADQPDIVGLKNLAWEKRESSHKQEDSKRVAWIAHGDKLSVEFWITVIPEHFTFVQPLDRLYYKGEPCYTGGFEIHQRSGRGNPDHDNCNVLGGKCWHDGSSLQASEFFEVWDQSDEQAILECARRVGGR